MKIKTSCHRVFQGYNEVDSKKRTIDRDIYIQSINEVESDSYAMSQIGQMVRICNRMGLNPLDEIGITYETLLQFKRK